jgi:phosphoribosylanthranilate isomerase
MTRVKICGIMNVEDALAAIEAGADALGFNFADSPRKVDIKTARRVISRLPRDSVTIGVFANQAMIEVVRILEKAGLGYAQIHGRVPANLRYGVNIPTLVRARPAGEYWGLIRAISVESATDIEQAGKDRLVEIADAILLDAHVEGKMGGTGQTFDWDLAIQAKTLGKPIILAGGLTPENVAEAIRKVQPYAVDVASGVEASPGKKDHDKIREFINNVRNA